MTSNTTDSYYVIRGVKNHHTTFVYAYSRKFGVITSIAPSESRRVDWCLGSNPSKFRTLERAKRVLSSCRVVKGNPHYVWDILLIEHIVKETIVKRVGGDAVTQLGMVVSADG